MMMNTIFSCIKLWDRLQRNRKVTALPIASKGARHYQPDMPETDDLPPHRAAVPVHANLIAHSAAVRRRYVIALSVAFSLTLHGGFFAAAMMWGQGEPLPEAAGGISATIQIQVTQADIRETIAAKPLPRPEGDKVEVIRIETVPYDTETPPPMTRARGAAADLDDPPSAEPPANEAVIEEIAAPVPSPANDAAIEELAAPAPSPANETVSKDIAAPAASPADDAVIEDIAAPAAPANDKVMEEIAAPPATSPANGGLIEDMASPAASPASDSLLNDIAAPAAPPADDAAFADATPVEADASTGGQNAPAENTTVARADPTPPAPAETAQLGPLTETLQATPDHIQPTVAVVTPPLPVQAAAEPPLQKEAAAAAAPRAESYLPPIAHAKQLPAASYEAAEQRPRRKRGTRAEGSETASLARDGGRQRGARNGPARRAALFAYRRRIRARVMSNLPQGQWGPGRVVVGMRFSRWGELLGATIARSSGSAMIDQAALNCVRMAGPYPRPPAGATPSQLALSMDFRFE